MDYPRDRAEGGRIGSGHIEAACKTEASPWLNQRGMRRGIHDADPVCHLRAVYEGEAGQWDALGE